MTDFELPAGQVALLDAVVAANPRTIVVLANGGVVRLSGFADRVPALLEGGRWARPWLGGRRRPLRRGEPLRPAGRDGTDPTGGHPEPFTGGETDPPGSAAHSEPAGLAGGWPGRAGGWPGRAGFHRT